MQTRRAAKRRNLDEGSPSSSWQASGCTPSQFPLASLPRELLHQHLLPALGPTIRGTCRWLRDAFDAASTHLVLGAAEFEKHQAAPEEMTDMSAMNVDKGFHRWDTYPKVPFDLLAMVCPVIRRMPNLVSLQRHQYLHKALPWSKMLAAAGPLVRSRLLHLDLRSQLGMSNLSLLSSLTRLRSLDLSRCTGIKDLGPLSSCRQLQQLLLTDCKVQSLEPLAACTALTHLDILGCHDVASLAPLVSCAAIRHLDTSIAGVDSLDPLSSLPQLRRLDLGDCGNKALPLPDLTGLTRLDAIMPGLTLTAVATACPALEHLHTRSHDTMSLGPLTSCVGLRYLSLVRCARGLSLAPLAELRYLQQLLLMEMSDVDSDLSALAGCTALQQLVLEGCNQITSLQPLAACSATLTHLHVSGVFGDKIAQLQAISHLTALRHLSIRDCYRTKQLPDMLAGCSALEHLDLRYNDILEELPPLKDCKALQSLRLTCCYKLSSLRHVDDCTALRWLDLSHCRLLQDLQPLAACTGLRKLCLACCDGLRSVAPLAACAALEVLNLQNCEQQLDVGCLSACTSLRDLNLTKCGKVRGVERLAACPALHKLRIYGHCAK